MKSEDFRNIYEYNPEKDKLGEGSFGNVYRDVQKDTKEKRAIKLIDINKFKKNYQQENFKLPSEEDIKR
jgi:serine/threonine protein kinase